jgi:hypothetical protein
MCLLFESRWAAIFPCLVFTLREHEGEGVKARGRDGSG